MSAVVTDYIERGDALDALAYFDEYSPTGKKAQDIIRELPAADVVERKRGRWVKARGSWCTPGGDPVWECSECGKGVHVYGVEHGSYGADVADGQWAACPNCGADMREST